MKRITDDVDSMSSFDELGLVQMPILAVVSAIEPFLFATTAMLELSGPEGIARKSSFIALSWTRTLSCISSADNGHTQPSACPLCTTSPMWLACDTSTRSSQSTFTSHAHHSQQPSMMRMPTPFSLGRTGLCVERFLASLFRCSSASAKSESA